MKDILENSGVGLLKIQPKEFSRLVADINYNFQQILQVPSFKGVKGDSVQGEKGDSVRGANWLFIDTSKFFEVYNLNSTDQINLSFLNNALEDNMNLLQDTLGVTDYLIEFDTIVIPNGDVIQLNVKEINGNDKLVFVDTGISFDSSQSLTEDKVRALIEELTTTSINNNGTNRKYDAIAKNFADNNGGVNNSINNDSVIDIKVSGAGSGVPTQDFTFFGSDEKYNINNICHINGSVRRYNELIQSTMEILTNAYCGGVDDLPINVMLQNNYKNGLLLGNKNENTFRNFSRIYKSLNYLNIFSSNSPNRDDYSSIQLGDNEIITHSDRIVHEATEYVNNATSFITNLLDFSDNTVNIGNGENTLVNIWGKSGIFLQNLKGVDFLSTDSNGRIYKKLSLVNDIENATKSTDILSGLTVKNALAEKESEIVSNSQRIHSLETVDNTIYFKKKRVISKDESVNLSSFTDIGYYVFEKRTTSLSGGVRVENELISQGYMNDIYLKVYVIHDGVHRYIKQEITYNKSKVLESGGIYGIDTSYYRIGKATINGSITFGKWNKILTSDTKITEGNGVSITGSLAENNLNIKHGSIERDTFNSNETYNNGVVSRFETDTFGHVTKVVKTDLDQRYTKEQDVVSLISGKVPVGCIMMWGSNIAPTGWAFCDGNKWITFNGVLQLPTNLYIASKFPDKFIQTMNMNGRFPFGAVNDINIGDTGGEREVTLNINQMPSHNHSYKFGVSGRGGDSTLPDARGYDTYSNNIKTKYTENKGGNTAHNNMPPYIGVRFIIKTHEVIQEDGQEPVLVY